MATRNSPMDQFLKEAYANVIANQLASGPTWQDAQQALTQQSGVAQAMQGQLLAGYNQAMQMPLDLNQYLPPASQQVAEAVARTNAALQAYQGFGTYGAPEVQRAAAAAPKPAEPKLLTYQEFHDIAAAIVARECPKAKLVTDHCGQRFVAYISCTCQAKDHIAHCSKDRTPAEVNAIMQAVCQVRLTCAAEQAKAALR